MKRWISMVLALQTGLMTVLAAMAFFLGKPNIVSTGLWAASLLVFLAGWASLGTQLDHVPGPKQTRFENHGDLSARPAPDVLFAPVVRHWDSLFSRLGRLSFGPAGLCPSRQNRRRGAISGGNVRRLLRLQGPDEASDSFSMVAKATGPAEGYPRQAL